MTDRFNPGPLIVRAFNEMRRRSQIGEEPPDRLSRLILIALPLIMGFTSWWFAWSVRSADSMVAGFSLLAAALLAVVPQLASWRQRLSDRNRASEGVARRKLDEAVANTLVGVLASIALALVSVILANIVIPSSPSAGDAAYPEVARLLTASLVAGGTYLGLVILLVVNLLFDAYTDASADSQSHHDTPRWQDHDDPGHGAA